MNRLDELLSATGQVNDITPTALRHGRAVLDSAIPGVHSTQSITHQAGPLHRPGLLRHRRMPWLLTASTVAAAAAVAVTTVTVLSHHSDAALAGKHPRGVASHPAPTQVSAAVLLRAAGKAAGEQPGGWPNAAYWHVVSVYVRDGKTYHRDIWISHHGNGVLRDDGVSSGLIDLGTAEFEGLTWAQLYALPTDRAQLQSVLESKFTQGYTSDANPSPSPGAVTQSAELYTVVGDLLRESPASPALREALYEVAANIPGVVVKGHYTDALGRTGMAIERDGETLIIDPGNGALLADISGNPNATFSCPPSTSPDEGDGACSFGGVGYTYVKQGPATSAP